MASSSFGQPGQQQQQPYMGGQFSEYGQPSRYGGGAHAGYGMLPYGAVPPAQYLPQNMPPPDGGYDADALALAQGMSSMVLGPGQQQMIQLGPGQYPYPVHQQPRMPAGYPPAGYAYSPQPQAPGLRGPAMGHQQQQHQHQQQPQQHQQQQQQQHYQQPPPQQGMGPPMGQHPMGPPMGMNGHHHPMDMRDMRGGLVQNGRGGPPARMGPPGPGPRGMGPQQQQMQRGGRKKVQRGLEDNVRRTVYISYIDQQVTEESLATFFADCGTVMDCRICGDPNSAMRFAFIEFMEESGAQEALKMTGSTLGKSGLRVLPSKTAIVPVNKELMPRSEEELERCSRTVYVANIDKKVEREDVRTFFEKLCGRIGKIRLLGDLQHSTRIAFIEFIDAEAAMAALNCSGALLGALPLRVSPSKTPVRGDKDDRESRQGRGRRNNQQQQQQAQQQQQGTDGSISSSASVDGAAAAPPAAAGTEEGDGPLTEATGPCTSADSAVTLAVTGAANSVVDVAAETPVDGAVDAATEAVQPAQPVEAVALAEVNAEPNGSANSAGTIAEAQQQQQAEAADTTDTVETAAELATATAP